MRRVALVVGIVVVVLLCIVWASLSIMHEGYRIGQLQAKRQALERATKDLEIEVASLSALDRIERKARQELGLVLPKARQVILVKRTLPQRR